mmetsp:Transcript_88764/g.206587  ORF Transcript_88764/g.206587 Transcript_88764/m.206587 type:complete len:308 (-) Transcript_88764:154-1077(-)
MNRPRFLSSAAVATRLMSALAMRCQSVVGAADLQWLRATLEAAAPPPGTLEVLTSGAFPRIVAVLHEARTPREVRRALEVVRGWLAFGSEDGVEIPSLTAVLGCEGEVQRGDRAKIGWALAETCDRIVLTTNQPRGEPPMQIIEDILEAIRSRVPCVLNPVRDLLPVQEVHVVADRVDGLKLGVCLGVRRPDTALKDAGPPGVVVVFGSSYADSQEVAGEDGHVRRWLCNDRRILLEVLENAERLAGLTEDEATAGDTGSVVDIREVPWRLSSAKASKRAALTLPGQSLHWTHDMTVCSTGSVEKLL